MKITLIPVNFLLLRSPDTIILESSLLLVNSYINIKLFSVFILSLLAILLEVSCLLHVRPLIKHLQRSERVPGNLHTLMHILTPNWIGVITLASQMKTVRPKRLSHSPGILQLPKAEPGFKFKCVWLEAPGSCRHIGVHWMEQLYPSTGCSVPLVPTHEIILSFKGNFII